MVAMVAQGGRAADGKAMHVMDWMEMWWWWRVSSAAMARRAVVLLGRGKGEKEAERGE